MIATQENGAWLFCVFHNQDFVMQDEVAEMGKGKGRGGCVNRRLAFSLGAQWNIVMAGLDPAIHVFQPARYQSEEATRISASTRSRGQEG